MKVAVLGGGRVGAAIVLDLAASGHEVTVADHDASTVERVTAAGGAPGSVRGEVADLLDAATTRDLAARHELVVGAVPGSMGFEVARAVLEAGRPLVDISFFPEDPFDLDRAARDAGVPCLVDCGVAPGLSNLVLGHLEATLDRTDSFHCMVGGLPVERRWPWEYKAPFSPGDVIEEYTRPARMRRGGVEVTLPALSGLQRVDLPGVGTLEAFNTDGLRTLLRTAHTPHLVEKTLRYPGHAERMAALRDAGFFSLDPVEVDGAAVVPRRVTETLLFDAWHLDDAEPELTVMHIEVEGEEHGRPVRHVFDLLDHTDPVTGTSSMARTTGYTCTAVVAQVASGAWNEPGVAAPEALGAHPDVYRAILTHLADRGVRLNHRVEAL